MYLDIKKGSDNRLYHLESDSFRFASDNQGGIYQLQIVHFSTLKKSLIQLSYSPRLEKVIIND